MVNLSVMNRWIIIPNYSHLNSHCTSKNKICKDQLVENSVWKEKKGCAIYNLFSAKLLHLKCNGNKQHIKLK